MKRMTFTVYEIEHHGDASASLDDLKSAGVNVIGYEPDYDAESMNVTADVPDSVNSLADLQSLCEFCCID